MALPTVIPISHEPDYRTDTIGRYADGQFYLAVNGAQPDGAETRDTIRWYAILHLFDEAGAHVRSDIQHLGTGPVAPPYDAVVASLLAGLPGATLGDIAIRPFSVLRDGVTFGLIDESDDERGDWAELHPERLGFGPPFDGTYDT